MYVYSSVTALTFTLEPVFAAVVGSAFLHEDFGLSSAIGGFLAISAVAVRCVCVCECVCVCVCV